MTYICDVTRSFHKSVEGFEIRFVAGFDVVVRGAATGVHGADGVPFEMRARRERNSAEVINVSALRHLHAIVALRECSPPA